MTHPRYEYHKAWRAANPDKTRESRQGWAKRNPDRAAAADRRCALRKKGITGPEFEAIMANQGFVCALCERPPEDSAHGILHIDHCHETGRVRGLLCHRCNVALGQFGDDTTVLRRAIAYLESPLDLRKP